MLEDHLFDTDGVICINLWIEIMLLKGVSVYSKQMLLILFRFLLVCGLNLNADMFLQCISFTLHV